jgi:hypothetical protein
VVAVVFLVGNTPGAITSTVRIAVQHALSEGTGTLGDPDVVHADEKWMAVIIVDDEFFDG